MPLNPSLHRSITAPTVDTTLWQNTANASDSGTYPQTTEIMFTMTWCALSHAAVPKMLSCSGLDENGLIPREFCPEVYDGVVCVSPVFLLRSSFDIA
jgi:hypothetical protein